MEATAGNAKVDLPAGVSIGPGIETSQLDAQGSVVQGMKFTLTTRNGSTSSIFIPYTEIHNTAKAKQLIDQRVAAITAISG